jgi:hypothetical protein
MTALIKPPAISKADNDSVIMNAHLRNIGILSPPINPVILNPDKTMSESRNKRNPYNMNASQKPPIILSTSVMTDECLDSRNLAATNIAARIKKESE